MPTYAFFFFFYFLIVFCPFRDAPMAYGGSQARGPIRATAASPYQSHSNARSEPCQRPTPQLTATPDPQPTKQGQVSNPQLHGSQSDLLPLRHDGNSFFFFFCLLGAAPTAYGGSQARGQITTATATKDPSCTCNLHTTAHGNARSLTC